MINYHNLIIIFLENALYKQDEVTLLTQKSESLKLDLENKNKELSSLKKELEEKVKEVSILTKGFSFSLF